MKKVRTFGFAVLAALWIALILGAWFAPTKDISEAERRKLAQMPRLSVETILNGKFMTDFEDFSLDQFPLRDAFRTLKAGFHYKVLRQGDNNGIYVVHDYAAKLEYPLNETSVDSALGKFNHIYETYLQDSDCEIFVSVVPDKSLYLAWENGYPAMDYGKLFDRVKDRMNWAEYVDLSDVLEAGSYYCTDTHWRQEKITEVAKRLCDAMGTGAFAEGELKPVAVEKPFYGVYYGQAALPMKPESMYCLQNERIDGCTVYNYETGKTTAIYDMEKLESRDLYDIYLSGAAALLTIDNPNAATDRELIVFRDSFGSSMIPLLLHDYIKVTVIDIRYVSPDFLGQIVEFNDQDVLFLYSTLVLNQSSTLK